MNPWQTFWSGIAPQHAAAFILTALLPGLWWLYRTITPPPATEIRVVPTPDPRSQ